MPIDTKHPEYNKFKPRWDRMDDMLEGQDTVRSKGEKYLPKTGGMTSDEDEKRYEAYKKRARFLELPSKGLTGIIGLVFENDPIGSSDEIITNSNQKNIELSRDVVRAVSTKGRDILVVDAPPGDGGKPYIARYSANSLINWKTARDNPADITLAVFLEEEEKEDSDQYSHETDTRYRQYLRIDGNIELSKWALRNGEYMTIEEPVILDIDFMPLVTVGSIDVMPPCDPIPLLSVADSALAYYVASASYKYSIHLACHPTFYAEGFDEESYKNMIQTGLGGGAAINVPTEGKIGFLEAEGTGISHAFADMEHELKQAESHSVRLTQDVNGVESGAAMGMRAAAQHASIYSVADAVSIGITRAQNMRAQWAGESEPEPFSIRTEFKQGQAEAQMVTAIGASINSGNAPQRMLYDYAYDKGMTEATWEEWINGIETSDGIVQLEP